MLLSRRVLFALLASLVVVGGIATGVEKSKHKHGPHKVEDVPDEKDILKDLEALNTDIKQERSRQKKEHEEIKKMLRGMSKKGLRESEDEKKPHHDMEEHHKVHKSAHVKHHKRSHELSHSKDHHGHKAKRVKAAEEMLLSEDEEDTSRSEAVAKSKLLSAFINVDKLPVSIASELSKNHEILSLGQRLEQLGSKRKKLVEQGKETSHIDKVGRHVSDKLKAAVDKGVQEIYARQVADVRNGDDDDGDDDNENDGDDFDDVRSEAVGSDTEMDEDEGDDDSGSEDDSESVDEDGNEHRMVSEEEVSSIGDPDTGPDMEDLAETPTKSKNFHVSQLLKRPLLPNQRQPPTPTNGGDAADEDDEDQDEDEDHDDESDRGGKEKMLSEVGHSAKQTKKSKKAVKSVATAAKASSKSKKDSADTELMEAARSSDGSTNLHRDVVTAVQVNKGKKKSSKSAKALKKVPSNGDDSDETGEKPSNVVDDGVIATAPDATNGDDELSSFEEGLKIAFAGLTKGVKGVHMPAKTESNKKSMAEMVEDSLHGKLDVDDTSGSEDAAESSSELNKTIEKTVDEQISKLGLATVGL